MSATPSVLIVDDDAAGLAMLSLSLRQSGFLVRTAESGEAALKLLRANRADWLVTDLRMHPMDGIELAAQAKSLQPDLRVVMVSAVYGERDQAAPEVEKFFPKPLAVDRLIDWLSPRSG